MTLVQRLRATALWLTVLSLLVVGISTYLRLDTAGPASCADGPACHGRVPVASEQPYYTPLRLAHRTVATVSLLLVVYLLWQCRRSTTSVNVAQPAAGLLCLMLALALLGVWSGEPRRTPIVFLNLLGGLALVSSSWRLVLATHVAEPLRSNPPTLRAGALLLTLTVLFGAGIGAGQLAQTCRSFPACDGQWWPGAADWAALLAFLKGQTNPGSGVVLHLLHRYGALCSLLLLGHGAWAVWRAGHRPRASAAVPAALAGTIAFGTATVISGLSVWLTTAHALCATVTLAALATLLKR